MTTSYNAPIVCEILKREGYHAMWANFRTKPGMAQVFTNAPDHVLAGTISNLGGSR